MVEAALMQQLHLQDNFMEHKQQRVGADFGSGENQTEMRPAFHPPFACSFRCSFPFCFSSGFIKKHQYFGESGKVWS